MAQQDINTGGSYDDPSADYVKDAFDKCQSNFDELYTFNLDHNPDNVYTEVISLGTWDMDATASVDISWAVPTGGAIVGMQAMILADFTAYTAVPINHKNIDNSVAGSILYDTDHFVVSRTASGYFDNTDYNRTDRARGYIKVDYIIVT